jgi:hypothetical protein
MNRMVKTNLFTHNKFANSNSQHNSNKNIEQYPLEDANSRNINSN